MSHQIDSNSKDVGTIWKKNEMQFLELKSAIAEVKISPELFSSVFEQAEERMRKLKSRLVDIIQSEVK